MYSLDRFAYDVFLLFTLATVNDFGTILPYLVHTKLQRVKLDIAPKKL